MATTFRYRACYNYKVVTDERNRPACEIILPASISEAVDEIPIFSITDNSSLLFIETPASVDGVYFSDTICYFIIGNK